MASAGLCGDGGSGSGQDQGYEELESVAEKVGAGYLGPVTNSEGQAAEAGKRAAVVGAVHGSGVFAVADIAPGAFIGIYGGTVMTEEEAEGDDGDDGEGRLSAAAAAAAVAAVTVGGAVAVAAGGAAATGAATAAAGVAAGTEAEAEAGATTSTPPPPQHHIFHIHHGAFAVCVDGSHGDGRNSLSSINHSCAPNAASRESP